jgi:glycosyltransferase involved in cell wall biosynthesis
MRTVVLDLTMNLVNRTAVHDMGMEIYNLDPGRFLVRYGRYFRTKPINFTKNLVFSVLGKAAGRLVFRDLDSKITKLWSRGGCDRIVFLEPLFSRKTTIARSDIVVCHDIAPITHPHFYDTNTDAAYESAYRRIQQVAPTMVFVSDFTKNAFLQRFPSNYNECHVIPLYFKPLLGGAVTPQTFAHPFILMVGTLERRKNYKAALEAFEKSGISKQGYHLLIVGPRGNLSRELLPIIAANEAMKHIGFVTDADLKVLYRNATALFFPSLIEGFGVPALEAPQSDLLPIVSQGTVLQEIVGPDCIFVDPTSIDSMVQGLRLAVTMDSEKKREKIARIKEYQDRYSLENFRSAWCRVLGLTCSPAFPPSDS